MAPKTVDIKINLGHVWDIDATEGHFHAKFKVYAEWAPWGKDEGKADALERLRDADGDKAEAAKKLSSFVEGVWTPELYSSNAIELNTTPGKLRAVKDQRGKLTGALRMTFIMKGKFFQNFTATWYPFDVQFLQLSVRPMKEFVGQVKLEAHQDGSRTHNVPVGLQLNDWKLLPAEASPREGCCKGDKVLSDEEGDPFLKFFNAQNDHTNYSTKERTQQESAETKSQWVFFVKDGILTDKRNSSVGRSYSQVVLFVPITRDSYMLLVKQFMITALLSGASMGVFSLDTSTSTKVTQLLTLLIAVSAERLRIQAALPQDTPIDAWAPTFYLWFLGNIFGVFSAILLQLDLANNDWMGDNAQHPYYVALPIAWGVIFVVVPVYQLIRGVMHKNSCMQQALKTVKANDTQAHHGNATAAI
jgi:hypothetical protein